MPPPDDEFMRMETAKAFGLSPRQFRGHSADDQARMIAHELIRGTREAYMTEMIKKRSEAKATSVNRAGSTAQSRQGGSTGMNAYEQQKAAMRARVGLEKP
jgi:hypothetical protein